jgi:hypothetical protein
MSKKRQIGHVLPYLYLYQIDNRNQPLAFQPIFGVRILTPTGEVKKGKITL